MMLDMVEWYLLFQPLFENYLLSIKSDRRDDSVSVVRGRPSISHAYVEKLFFQSVDIPHPVRDVPTDINDQGCRTT